MTTMADRKTVSVHDYPEHLNPFREDDNHNKIRFWTLGKRLNRSNSINFSGIKDLKNSWAFRSFMRKGKKRETPSQSDTKINQVNGDTSPIVFRRALQYSTSANRSTVGTTDRSTVATPDRYVYGGSITPLPRSRFQERLRSTSHQEVSDLSTPRLARSEASGSRLSVESQNPFDQPPVPPVRASRRKKKKAPLPPGGLDTSITSETSELQTSAETSQLNSSVTEDTKPGGDLEVEELNLNIELKIVEDEDDKNSPTTPNSVRNAKTPDSADVVVAVKQSKEITLSETPPTSAVDDNMNKVESEEDILTKVSFAKVDIGKYRRNSSVNEDDVRLRRGNLEDYHILTTKRSKSFNNNLDSTYVSYDINLNEKGSVDSNINEEPHKVVCKLYENTSRKQSIDTISSTEKEFMEIDKVTRELESDIYRLNAALEEDFASGPRISVSEIKKKFDNSDLTPNPIPKPRRSNYSESGSPVNAGSPVNGNGHL